MTRLIWFDMETTGLRLDDAILEVGGIMTDEHFAVFDTFHRIVSLEGALYPSGGSVESGIALSGKEGGVEPIVVTMHEHSGLWREMANTDRRETAMTAMEDFFVWVHNLTNDDTERFCMAGSGVSHFDFPYLKHHFPVAMDRFFTYHQRDVGSIRRFVLENCSPDASELVKSFDIDPPHRVMPDLELFIRQAKVFRMIINGGARAAAERDTNFPIVVS